MLGGNIGEPVQVRLAGGYPPWPDLSADDPYAPVPYHMVLNTGVGADWQLWQAGAIVLEHHRLITIYEESATRVLGAPEHVLDRMARMDGDPGQRLARIVALT